MNAIDISGLRVRYGALEAVRGIDLHVPQGSLFAFLGPNGAGKSTTLSVLSTLLAPSAGSILVAGHALAARTTPSAAQSASSFSRASSTTC